MLDKTMRNLFEQMDVDGNGTITKEEFLSMRNNVTITSALEKLEIASDDFDKYAALLFTPKNEGDDTPALHYEACVDMIMKLRPGHSANACDFAIFKMEC